MEQFVQSLYDRLPTDAEKMRLIAIMDNAINEMHNAGVFTRVSPELQAKIHAEDPQERIEIKAAVAKRAAYDNFILSSKPVALNTGELGHMIAVHYDPRFTDSIRLCIQGGLEGLFQAGAYKKNESGYMNYYIRTDTSGDTWAQFREKLLELECFYDEFHLIVIPQEEDEPAGQNETPKSDPASVPAEKPKKSFLEKLGIKKGPRK